MIIKLCDSCGVKIEKDEKDWQVLVDCSDGSGRKGNVFEVCKKCAEEVKGMMVRPKSSKVY